MIVGTDGFGVHAHPSLPLALRQIIRLNLELANKPDGSYDNSVPKTLSASLMFWGKAATPARQSNLVSALGNVGKWFKNLLQFEMITGQF